MRLLDLLGSKSLRGPIGLLLLLMVGCGETRGRNPGDPQIGETSFESAGNAGTRRGSDTAADAGVAGPDEDDEEERAVEEADIYRFVGDRLYVLNQYRGLYVFDVSNPDSPVELGRMPLVGYPVEMYVRGDRAYAIISDYFTYWRDETALDAGLDYLSGSRIVGIDLSDPSAPFEIGDVVLDGEVSDTRLVGDVIYAVANQYPFWEYFGDVDVSSTQSGIVLTSIDISNPARMRQVEKETLDGSGWYVHATSDALIVAGTSYYNGTSDSTDVVYIDISSPRGDMVHRGSLNVSGYMQDDTALDVYENQLRVLTRSWEHQTTKLRIFDTSNPDELTLLGDLDYEYRGGLFGTTFADDRMYMVHYEVIDPLEVVDLSDPTDPRVVGILEAPGWIDRIVPVGDQLVGLGTDDSDGSRRTSVSLIDVSNPTEPTLLDRLTVGEAWSWSYASWERKAWSVLAEERLALFPFSGYNEELERYRHVLGIVELGDTTLRARGQIESPAPVERGTLHEGRVYCLSQEVLQVVDIRDRDEPVARATVELARNVADYGRGDEVGVELIHPPGFSWWGGGDEPSILRVTALETPDSSGELGRLQLPRIAEALLVKDDIVLAIHSQPSCYGGYYEDGYDGCGDEAGEAVMVVSVADPSRPRLLSTVELPPGPKSMYADDISSSSYWQTRYGSPVGGWQGGAGALDLGGGKYAMLRTEETSCWSKESCRRAGIGAIHVTYGEGDYRSDYWYGQRYKNLLAVIDVSKPSDPKLSTFELGEGDVEHLFVNDGLLVYSHAIPSRVDAEGRSYVRYYMERRRIEEGFKRLPSINVPGVVVELRDRGETAFTLDYTWDETPGEWSDYQKQTWLNAVVIDGDRAVRSDIVPLGNHLGSMVTRGNTAYAVSTRYYGEVADGGYQATLLTVDTSDPWALQVESQGLGRGYDWWTIAGITETSLALSGSGGMAIFDVEEGEQPTFDRFVRTRGWAASILQDGARLFLAGGPYGIQTVTLD